jgi:hypothetical protein
MSSLGIRCRRCVEQKNTVALMWRSAIDVRPPLVPMLKYNIDDGFLDSLVRGYRSAFLSTEDYSNLAQSQTVEDIRMHLQTTDYGNFLESEGANAVRISALHTAATDKMVREFNYLRCHAVYPLSQFLDYITHGFMIDNVALILTGTLRNPTKEYELPPLTLAPCFCIDVVRSGTWTSLYPSAIPLVTSPRLQQ